MNCDLIGCTFPSVPNSFSLLSHMNSTPASLKSKIFNRMPKRKSFIQIVLFWIRVSPSTGKNLLCINASRCSVCVDEQRHGFWSSFKNVDDFQSNENLKWNLKRERSHHTTKPLTFCLLRNLDRVWFNWKQL